MPSFSFEGNEGMKKKIIQAKEEYSRGLALSIYYDNMSSYLKPHTRGK